MKITRAKIVVCCLAAVLLLFAACGQKDTPDPGASGDAGVQDVHKDIDDLSLFRDSDGVYVYPGLRWGMSLLELEAALKYRFDEPFFSTAADSHQYREDPNYGIAQFDAGGGRAPVGLLGCRGGRPGFIFKSGRLSMIYVSFNETPYEEFLTGSKNDLNKLLETLLPELVRLYGDYTYEDNESGSGRTTRRYCWGEVPEGWDQDEFNFLMVSATGSSEKLSEVALFVGYANSKNAPAPDAVVDQDSLKTTAKGVFRILDDLSLLRDAGGVFVYPGTRWSVTLPELEEALNYRFDKPVTGSGIVDHDYRNDTEYSQVEFMVDPWRASVSLFGCGGRVSYNFWGDLLLVDGGRLVGVEASFKEDAYIGDQKNDLDKLLEDLLRELERLYGEDYEILNSSFTDSTSYTWRGYPEDGEAVNHLTLNVTSSQEKISTISVAVIYIVKKDCITPLNRE